jgi:hypothetical protein
MHSRKSVPSYCVPRSEDDATRFGLSHGHISDGWAPSKCPLWASQTPLENTIDEARRD